MKNNKIVNDDKKFFTIINITKNYNNNYNGSVLYNPPKIYKVIHVVIQQHKILLKITKFTIFSIFSIISIFTIFTIFTINNLIIL